MDFHLFDSIYPANAKIALLVLILLVLIILVGIPIWNLFVRGTVYAESQSGAPQDSLLSRPAPTLINKEDKTSMKSEKSKRSTTSTKADTLVIKDSEFETKVESAERALGMEVNRPAQLSGVKSKLTVKSAKEAVGFSTNQGLTSSFRTCPFCKNLFPFVYTGQRPKTATCPHCGKVHDVSD